MSSLDGHRIAKLVLTVLMGIFFVVLSYETFMGVGGIVSFLPILVELMAYVLIVWQVVWRDWKYDHFLMRAC